MATGTDDAAVPEPKEEQEQHTPRVKNSAIIVDKSEEEEEMEELEEVTDTEKIEEEQAFKVDLVVSI